MHELNIIPPIDYSRVFEDGYYDEMAALSSKILQEYLPYVSDYNSMVLFSLNGICPDDNDNGFGNNIFSNKKVAIIEPLALHIDQVVSLAPTDTALKGDVVLSPEAIVMIEEGYYAQLTEEQKQVLHNNCFKVKTFNGTTRDAIYTELQNSGRFIPETLSLSSSSGGFKDSKTSEMQKQCIDGIAASYGIPQMKYYNLITSRDTTMPNYHKVCDEYSNAYLVQKNYIVNFLNELLIFFGASHDMIDRIADEANYQPFLADIMQLIKEKGIDNYKTFVDSYNKKLELQQANMTLITPEEIVNSNKKKSQSF